MLALIGQAALWSLLTGGPTCRHRRASLAWLTRFPVVSRGSKSQFICNKMLLGLVFMFFWRLWEAGILSSVSKTDTHLPPLICALAAMGTPSL